MVLRQGQEMSSEFSADRSATTKSSQDGVRPREQWSGIIGTGQSLSVGFQAWLNEPTASAPGGLKLEDEKDKYDLDDPHCDTLKVVPFTEPIRPLTQMPNWYPGNINGKTPQHAMICQIAKLCADEGISTPVTVHTCVGKNGAPLFEIRRGGTANAYEASMYEVKALTRLAKQHNADLTYKAIVMTHCEADALLGHETYAEELIEFHEAYVEDCQQITGNDSVRPVLIQSQQQSFHTLKDIESQLIHDQWWAQRIAPHGDVFCAGPKYQYGYAPGAVHLPLTGYDRLGEKYGQVYFETVVKRNSWAPVAPKSIFLLDKDFIVVALDVKHKPLQWDDLLPKPHIEYHHAWAKGRGFEVRNGAGKELEIKDVYILSNDESVGIKLTTPTSKLDMPLQLAYAMTPDVDSAAAGESEGRMGHLCDSDPLESAGKVSTTVAVQNKNRILHHPKAWETFALYDTLVDLATGDSYVVIWLSEEESTKVGLSKSWQGPSSDSADVQAYHNQRNYCVTFALPVAYPLGSEGDSHRDVKDDLSKEQLEIWRGHTVNHTDECIKKSLLS